MCFCSDLLDFVDEGRESLQDIPDEEREPLGSPEFPQLHPAAELSTPEQRSQQHEASLAEDVPELAEDDDAQEELNQSEEEELMDSEPANHSPEFPEEEDEDDDEDALSAGDSHFHIQFIMVNQFM